MDNYDRIRQMIERLEEVDKTKSRILTEANNAEVRLTELLKKWYMQSIENDYSIVWNFHFGPMNIVTDSVTTTFYCRIHGKDVYNSGDIKIAKKFLSILPEVLFNFDRMLDVYTQSVIEKMTS